MQLTGAACLPRSAPARLQGRQSSNGRSLAQPVSPLHFPAVPAGQPGSGSGYRRHVTVMGNKGSTGPFAPLVRVVRDAMGTKEFNKFRGQAISLHSQVIKEFGKNVGVDNKQVQGLIRLAKKNGEKLGFLA